MIGCKPKALAEAVVLLLFCDGSMGRERRAAGAADVVAGGALPSNMASVGILPEGGGTGPNKLFPELEADDSAGPVVCAGTAAAGTFVTFVVGAVAAGAAAWFVSIAGGVATAG